MSNKITIRPMKDSKLSIEQATKLIAMREPIFHHPEFGTSRADFESMIAQDFWEIGASGRKYSKSEILDILETRYSVPVIESYLITDFACQELAPNLYLTTYELDQEGRHSRRSTIWSLDGNDWKIVYHQGTLISA